MSTKGGAARIGLSHQFTVGCLVDVFSLSRFLDKSSSLLAALRRAKESAYHIHTIDGHVPGG